METHPQFASLAAWILRTPVGSDDHGGVNAYDLREIAHTDHWHLAWRHKETGYYEPALPLFSDGEQEDLKKRIAALEAFVTHLSAGIESVHDGLNSFPGDMQLPRANATALHAPADASPDMPPSPSAPYPKWPESPAPLHLPARGSEDIQPPPPPPYAPPRNSACETHGRQQFLESIYVLIIPIVVLAALLMRSFALSFLALVASPTSNLYVSLLVFTALTFVLSPNHYATAPLLFVFSER